MTQAANTTATNFIRQIIDQDLKTGKNGSRVATRFPPEPNGYLHIGHAKSICLNFGIARDYSGICNLRFDDTNPAKEDIEYVNSIKEDVQWLGFQWSELFFASDYFDKIFSYAQELIRLQKAYVCELSGDEIRQYRGTLSEPGKESPFRNRGVDENLALFEKMRAGGFEEGQAVLRAKIDMKSPNINLRDPVIYRIKKAHHHKTGDKWCIYPMYDYAHCISDMLEGITHSICTLEFEDHRPLYDWFLKELKTPCHPQQIEFSRLNIDYTVMSKRKLLELVTEKHVHGWDDPRMPTLQGFRRRGYTPAALRDFCERIGVTKKDGRIDIATLEASIREDLDKNAPRAMAVLNPVKVVIENYDDQKVEELQLKAHMQKPELGMRKVPFSKELYIEAEDFMENPPADYFRLAPGREVRLRNAYIMKCVSFTKDASGQVTEIRTTIDPETLGKNPSDGRKVKGIIHWVSVPHAVQAEVRLYDHLVLDAAPGDDYLSRMNPNSLVTQKAWVEPSLLAAAPESRFQFERLGYFVADRRDHVSGSKAVFNRTVSLRDTFQKG